MAPQVKVDVKKGEKVQAKWSGSSIYYPATVLSLSGQQCKVQFEDGSVKSVKVSDLKFTKPVSATRRSARNRSRSTSASRAARSSLSRSPSRRVSRSPSRKASTPKPDKKPANKREKNSNSVTKVEESKSSKKVEELSRSSITKSLSMVTTNSTTEKIVYSSDVTDKGTSDVTAQAVQRSSARIAALQLTKSATRTPEPVVVMKRIALKTRSKAFSDDEEEEEDEDTEEEEDTAAQQKFSYLVFSWTALKIMLLPLIVLFFSFGCTKKSCNLLETPMYYSEWSTFINSIKYPLPACAALHLALFILSKLPIGKKVKGFPHGSKENVNMYRLNGIFILLLTLATFGGSYYFDLPLNWGYNKIKGITVSSLVYCVLWSFVLHFVGLCKKTSTEEDMKANKRAGILGSFFNGHEINPVLCLGEDVKTTFIHFGLIGLVLLDLSIFVKTYLMKGWLIPLVMTSFMHLLFVLDYFVREEVMLSSTTYTNDGVGYGFIVAIGCVIPCSFAIQTAYHLAWSSKLTHMPNWCAGGILLLYILGYYIYFSSSSLKHSFRRNPFSPSLSHVQSIPTSRKKRLIISGLWSIVRHPNYLGLIIMSIASSLPCGFSHVLPFTPSILLTLMLCLRMFSVESLCKEKYGPAWKNYTDRVRSRLIPYVF